MCLSPADIDAGITFIRTDVPGIQAEIVASWDRVIDTKLCTVIGNDDGVSVGTIEHIMAALRGCGVDNAAIRIDGPEVPIMDGSAAPFVFLIECAGIVEQEAPRAAVRVLKPVHVGDRFGSASLSSGDDATFSFEIDFQSAAVARQTGFFRLTGSAFKSELSRARTFGFLHEVDHMRELGLARGGSLDNAVVVSGDTVLNEGGLRYDDEFVRHKILDSVGDLYLAGAPVIGHFHGCRSGHRLNNLLLRALFADRSAWCWEAGAGTDELVPFGWQPHARLAVGA